MQSFLPPPALRQLFWMQVWASGRRLYRGIRTLKGAIFLCVAVVFYGWWLVPVLFLSRSGVSPFGAFREQMGVDPVETFLAPGLLLLTITTLLSLGSESGIFFLAEEIDLLFPGPFQRRDLLLYRLAGWGTLLLFGSLFFSIFALGVTSNWIYGFCGIYLALSFGQLFHNTIIQVIGTIGARAYSLGRKVFLAIVLCLVVAAVATQLRLEPPADWWKFFLEIRTTGVGFWLLAPFDVFAKTITAKRFFPEFLGWGSLAVLIDFALLCAILRLDVNFFESSIAASQKKYRQLEQARKGQVWKNFSRPNSGKLRVPQFPRCSGAGPIAWRQFVTALRGMRGVILFLLLMGFSMAAPQFFIMRHSHNAPPDDANFLLLPILSVGLVWSVLLLPQMLQFDFRGDLENMDVLKTLPVSAAWIVLGELFTPVLFCTLIQYVPLALLALYMGSWDPLLTVLVVLLPMVNLLVFAIENLVFLWYPHRTGPAGPADIQAMAQQMILMLIKILTLGADAAIAAGFGGLAWYLTDGSRPITLIISGVVLTAFGMALLPLVANAFRRFDPSLDTGE